MLALVTELLFSFVLLAFLVLSCQSVLHIASGTVRSVLIVIHAQLDRELGEDESLPDDEQNVTTRVVRRRVILKGDDAVDLPGEQVSEEQFTDEHGNIVTKKVVRKVVRRGKGGDEVQDVTIGRLPQEVDELDANAEQFMSYAVLGCESKQEVVDVKKGGAQIVKCASLRRVKQ